MPNLPKYDLIKYIANHTVTIDADSAKLLSRELEHLEEIKKTILKLIPESLLPRGSALWWEKATLEGLEDVKKGRVKKFNNVEEAIRYLHSSR